MSNVQRLLRQSVRDIVELAGHTEIVVAVQNGCMAHRTMRHEIGRYALVRSCRARPGERQLRDDRWPASVSAELVVEGDGVGSAEALGVAEEQIGQPVR